MAKNSKQDERDLAEARRILKKNEKRISWKDLKKELGLKED